MVLSSVTFAAILLSASTQVAAPAAAPLAKFSDLPNVTVTYYDVQGENVRAVHKAIEAAAPRDPVTNRPVPATSDWSVSAAVGTDTSGAQCKIANAKLNFAASAKMPRLMPIGANPIDPVLQEKWGRYVAELEARQVAQLRFAYDRLAPIEQQILATSCKDWKSVTTAAIDKVKKDKAAARASASAPPKLEDQ